MVEIGSARINEYGTLEGGKAGDQNGKECMVEPWYKHNKGWYVIRVKNDSKRKLIARDMRFICDNDLIGYSYWDNCYGLFNASKPYGFDASKVKTPCDTNCAKAVLTCARYAGVNVADFSTGDELEKFVATGEVEVFKDSEHCDKPDLLLEGDILVTRTKGHTVVVLNDDKAMDKIKWSCSTEYCGNYRVQGNANLRKYPSLEGEVLSVVDSGLIVFSDGIAVAHEDRLWYHIILNEDTEGFISGKLLERIY